MLSSIFQDLSSQCRHATERSEGAAFLKASVTLYGLRSLCYLGLNIAKGRGAPIQSHCIYSDRSVREKVGRGALSVDRLVTLGLLDPEPMDWGLKPGLSDEFLIVANSFNATGSDLRLLSMVIPTTHEETALLGIATILTENEWANFKASAVQDLRILSTYFHGHVLRLHRIDAAGEMIISARELDCLKWTAAGKTAWEASRILGISERTVRFHLNSAREKLNCSNTTQAVAVAVAQRMIAI